MKRLIAVVRARGISQWRNHELSTRLTLHHLDSLLLELGADGLHIAWCYGSLWLWTLCINCSVLCRRFEARCALHPASPQLWSRNLIGCECGLACAKRAVGDMRRWGTRHEPVTLGGVGYCRLRIIVKTARCESYLRILISLVDAGWYPRLLVLLLLQIVLAQAAGAGHVRRSSAQHLCWLGLSQRSTCVSLWFGLGDDIRLCLKSSQARLLLLEYWHIAGLDWSLDVVLIAILVSRLLSLNHYYLFVLVLTNQLAWCSGIDLGHDRAWAFFLDQEGTALVKVKSALRRRMQKVCIVLTLAMVSL